MFQDCGVEVNLAAVSGLEECKNGIGQNPFRTELINAVGQVDVTEVYSPPRVTLTASTFGLNAGESMDLTTGWDFRLRADRKRAMQYVRKYRPKLVIGSPVCAMFDSLQNLRPWNPEKQQKWIEAVDHMDFVVKLYEEQRQNGRWFLHEHPAGASSWNLSMINKLSREQDVFVVIAHQCQFGLMTPDGFGQDKHAKKPTTFMTNNNCIAEELNRKCHNEHAHQILIGNRAKDAAKYPRGLCEAICRCLRQESAKGWD